VRMAQADTLAAALGLESGALLAFRLDVPTGLARGDVRAPGSGSFSVQVPRQLAFTTPPPARLALGENFSVVGTVLDGLRAPCRVLGYPEPWSAELRLHSPTRLAHRLCALSQSECKRRTDSANASVGWWGGGPSVDAHANCSGLRGGPLNISFVRGVAAFGPMSINVTAEDYQLELRASDGDFVVWSAPFAVGPPPPPSPPPPFPLVLVLSIVGCLVLTCLAQWLRWWWRRPRKIAVLEMPRVPTPDQNFLPRPKSFLGVGLRELFAMDPTCRATCVPTFEAPGKLIVRCLRARNRALD
jgi:hypothetical protein